MSENQTQPEAGTEIATPTLSGAEVPALSYFDQRMQLLGITPEHNRINILKYNADKKVNELVPTEVFKADDKGIRIYVYTLDRTQIRIERNGNRWKDGFYITRLQKPYHDKKGKPVKYLIPQGTGTYPFFSPQLIDKYDAGTPIDTLVLTEGYFKAFKGCMHGMDVVGLSSITHYKDKDTRGLHEDIIKLIKKCAVKRMVILYDGDCNTLSTDAIEKCEDIYKKPKGFLSSAQTIRGLLEDFNIPKYFAHIDTDNIEGHPKGLDDLFVQFQGKEDMVTADFNVFGKPNKYFYKEDITFGITKLINYFHLSNPLVFLEYHCQKYSKLKDIEFVFNGTKYKWDQDKQDVKMIIHADVRNYMRVGDQYYEFVEIPNKYKELERYFHRRQKSTIQDDYGPAFVKQIVKYKAFCNLPSHTHYELTPNFCFNMYAPFDHEPQQGECPVTLKFLKHIFGEEEIHWQDPKTKEKFTYTGLDLGLDYITLLYQKPTQILPILCLVSREQGTGKTTFATLLKMIFTANVAIVGNAELADNFNASWASKLIIVCDEAKIDKQVVVEKVKSLSTASKVMMNAKGKDHVEIDFFGKFLFMTNNEENFIYASDDDVRYWVRKIPRIADAELNIHIIQEMKDEIPYFLNYLNHRKIKTTNQHRAWFHPDLIKTEALQKVVAFSRSTVEKEIRQKIRDMFFDHGVEEILMTRAAVQENLLTKKYEANYLDRVLKEDLKLDMYHDFEYNGIEYKSLSELKHANKECDETKITKKYKTKRHSFPRWETRVMENGNTARMRVLVQDNGRPFLFYRTQFLLPDEIKHLHVDDEAQEAITIMKDNGQTQMSLNGTGKDMPF